MEITELPVPEQVKEVLIKSGIVKLYPPQEEAIKAGALEGKNLVLASPTASGKTLVAELCALKHVLERNGKVIYLTPLRALANEKFEEFKKYASLRKSDGRRVRVGISTGDFDSVTSDARILVEQNGVLELTTVGQFVDRKMAEYKTYISTNGKEVCLLHDDKIKVFAIDGNGKVVLAHVKAAIRHKTHKPIYEIETRTGRKIKVTGDHCLFTIDEERIIKPVRAADLKEGQSYIAVPRILPYHKKPPAHLDLLDRLEEFQDCWIMGHSIKDLLSFSTIWKTVYNKYKVKKQNIYYWKRKGLLPMKVLIELLQDKVINLDDVRRGSLYIVKNRAKIPSLIRLDNYLMMFIGLWLADGSYYNAGVSISSGPDINCRKVISTIARRFNIKTLETDNGVTYFLGSRLLKRVMLKIMGLKGDAYTRKVPSWIFSLSNNQIANLLKGYFIGDGNSARGEVKAYSYSNALLQDVQTLLLRFGIISMLRKGTLRIPRKWSVAFGKKIKFLPEYQNGNAKSASNFSYYDIIPLCGEFAQKAGFRWAYYVGKANITSNAILQLLKRKRLTNEKRNVLKRLVNSQILWDKVIGIKRLDDAETYVYDLSVPPYENFICENVVAKNSSDPWLGRYDVIITTNEKTDSLLRHRAKWMDEISLIVADEVHLLNDAERGPTLEVVLARFMQINPNVQILALSATINNVEEIAAWLKAGYVTTEWRPILLKEGVLLQDEVQFKDGDAHKIEGKTRNPAINLALSTVKAGGQALIFASTRKNAVMLAKKVADEIGEILSRPVKRSLEHEAERILAAGEKTRISETLAELVKRSTAFHHAGLGGEHRKIIEDAFREGKIKVLTATPTLAFGVNLPARTVVIHDYRRYEPGYGYYPISVLEYKQMAGRAGRPKYDKVGEAILIAKTDEEADYLMESYILASPERIWSRLAVERILRSHVLATIAADFARTERGIYDFFGRTFYAYQYEASAMKDIVAKILKYLYDEEMIDVAGENIYATKFGKRVSELYIDPVSAVIIRNALRRKPQRLTEFSLLHLISHTPDVGPVLRPFSRELDEIAVFMEEHKEELLVDVPDEWEDRVAYEQFLGEVKTAMVLEAWIEEKSEDEIIEKFGTQPGDLYRTIENAKWLLYATHELGVLFGSKEMLPLTLELMERVEKGVKKELLPIVKLEGVGRIRGRILYNAGYKTIEDIKTAAVEDLMNLPLIGPRLAKKIKEQVGGFVRKDMWEKLEKEDAWKQKALTEY